MTCKNCEDWNKPGHSLLKYATALEESLGALLSAANAISDDTEGMQLDSFGDLQDAIEKAEKVLRGDAPKDV